MSTEVLRRISAKDLQSDERPTQAILQEVMREYEESLAGGFKVSAPSVSYSATDDTYSVMAEVESLYSPSSTTPTDPNSLQWVLNPNTTSPVIYTKTPSILEYEPVELSGLSSGPVELSDESKALLKSVEEKVSELLGKHPYARMANMRKAIDELLAGREEGRFEGLVMVDCLNGLKGWEARWSERVPRGTEHHRTEPVPTEVEALAEMIRTLTK